MTAAFFHQTEDHFYSMSNESSSNVGRGHISSSGIEPGHQIPMIELPEPPIPLSEIGPIPPPAMFSTPSPVAPRGLVQIEREKIQQREREQYLAAAIAMVVQNARSVDAYQLSQGNMTPLGHANNIFV